jgi:hypothetical protein
MVTIGVVNIARYGHYKSVGTPGLEIARTTCYLATFISFMLTIAFAVYIEDIVWAGKFFYLMMFMLTLGVVFSAGISLKRGRCG